MAFTLAMTMLSEGASAAVIYDNGGPDEISTLYSDPSYFLGCKVADDFILGSAASVINLVLK